MLSDVNTYAAAGERVCELLRSEKIDFVSFSFDDSSLEPCEKTVGGAFMHLSPECDMIIAVGSGVINDTAKIIAINTGLPFVIVATAPSMDGYASKTSSMTRDGFKISLPSRPRSPVIIAP